MADYIDRGELLNILYSGLSLCGGNSVANKNLIEKIKSMPSVDAVEQKHGHWKRRNMDIVEHPLHCTLCGWSNYHIDRYVESFKFCPHCGAKMR